MNKKENMRARELFASNRVESIKDAMLEKEVENIRQRALKGKLSPLQAELAIKGLTFKYNHSILGRHIESTLEPPKPIKNSKAKATGKYIFKHVKKALR